MPEDDGADIIISGGRLHHVEEVPTTNVSAKDMDNFLKDHADRMRKEKDEVAARAQAKDQQHRQHKVAFTIPKTASSPITYPVSPPPRSETGPVENSAAATQPTEVRTLPPTMALPMFPAAARVTTGDLPTQRIEVPKIAAEVPVTSESPTETSANLSDTKRKSRAEIAVAALAVMASTKRPSEPPADAAPESPPADASKENTMTESIADPSTGNDETSGIPAASRPSSGRRPSRRGDAVSAGARKAGPKPKKKTSSTEKWLYGFIVVCIIGGGLNFYLRKKPEVGPPPVVAPPRLAQTDRIWLAAEEEAVVAEAQTKLASIENRDGSKEKATEMYKEAAALWVNVLARVDELQKLGVDLDAPGYERWQKKITAWTASLHECLKFQTLESDDGWDYEEEQRKARERNRLDAEKGVEEEKK